MYLPQLKNNYLTQHVHSAKVEKPSPKLALTCIFSFNSHNSVQFNVHFPEGQTEVQVGHRVTAQCCLPPRPVLLIPCSLLSVFLRQLMAVAPQGIPRPAVLRGPLAVIAQMGEWGWGWGESPVSRWGTGTSCWGIDTSCLAGRGLSVPALQLLHPSPTEGLDPDAPRATHALPRGAPHHQRHPLYCSLLRRSLTGWERPPQTFSSWSTTTAQQPPAPRGPGNGIQPPGS